MRKIEIVMLINGIYVLLLGVSKREFFGSINEAELCDNKKFWDVVQSLSSKKVASNEKSTLVENDKIVENYKSTAYALNEFFSNIITTLEISEDIETEPVRHNIL